MPEPGTGGGYPAPYPRTLTNWLSSTIFSSRRCPAFQEKPMPTNGSPRILIVDDEVEITEILADLLSEDYDCLRAASAEEALARLTESEFQLVISDRSEER